MIIESVTKGLHAIYTVVTSSALIIKLLGFSFRHLNARKHQIKYPCCKRYKISRKYLDEKAKCQLWIINIWMKKTNLDENHNKIG